VVALVALVALTSLAVWVAYALPGQTPARVPAAAVEPSLIGSADAGDAVVVARVDDVDVLLPVARQATTAVAFHPVDNSGTVPFTPVGDRLGGGDLGQKLADIFAGGGGVQYYLMGGTGGEESPSTSGLDIGSVPGAQVVSPVDGKITAIKDYSILGRHDDVEINIQMTSDPSLLLVVTHIEEPEVEIGEVVQRGTSVLGTVRGFPSSLEQALSQYTSDNGDHVQLFVLRVTPELTSL